MVVRRGYTQAFSLIVNKILIGNYHIYVQVYDKTKLCDSALLAIEREREVNSGVVGKIIKTFATNKL